jgi:hypothetical protein
MPLTTQIKVSEKSTRLIEQRKNVQPRLPFPAPGPCYARLPVPTLYLESLQRDIADKQMTPSILVLVDRPADRQARTKRPVVSPARNTAPPDPSRLDDFVQTAQATAYQTRKNPA